MFRWLIVLMLAVCVAAGVAYYNGWLDDALANVSAGQDAPQGETVKGDVVLGEPLYAAVPLPPLPAAKPQTETELAIGQCHAVVPDSHKQDVSSPKDGKMLLVGFEVGGQSGVSPKPGRPVLPVEIFDGKQKFEISCQPLREGDIVEWNQVVVKLDPALASLAVAKMTAKIKMAESDYASNEALLKESNAKWDRLKQLRQQPGGEKLVTNEELGIAQATVEKYGSDRGIKREAINSAIVEKQEADIALSDCDLRCKLPGKSIVKKIWKGAGENIKALDPVLQLHNLSRLRIEGTADSQFFGALRAQKNARCYLEPSEEMKPGLELIQAHRGEVTCVAVCADGEHFVSGSKDGTVCVWKRDRAEPLLTLPQRSAVRTLAASPHGTWLLVGGADGSISRWDLANPSAPVHLPDRHRGPVTALAFSPDGAWFASGGEDSAIFLWKTGTGEVLYPFDADHGVDSPHQGTITSLCFTPQCTLVSAARDNTLRVWALHQQGARQAAAPIAHRDGAVGQLGVSADGRFLLFDKGRTLQVLSAADGRTLCVLNNLGSSNPFDTLALFSPDGSLILTGGAGDGRLHLWKSPAPGERAYQVRELVTKDHAAITAAAFAPAGRRFAVSGSKEGYVHLWSLPDEAVVRGHRILADADNQPLHIDLVEQSIDAGKIRVAVDVHNPLDANGDLRLVPGQRVTLVVVLPPVMKQN